MQAHRCSWVEPDDLARPLLEEPTMIRRSVATLAAVALLLALAAPVFAGGWADIVADAQTTEPVEGQPVDVGFVVLQHGQTPAPWETATVHFTNASTGKTIDVIATNDRKDGHFVATATLPEAGYWSWQVTLQDLETAHMPVVLAVRTGSGHLPAYDPATTVTAISQAKQDVAEEINARFYPEIERLDGLLSAEKARSDRLLAQTNEMIAERDELGTRLAAVDGAGGLPLIALVTLAVLAGATAGFAMSWLNGRPSPRVTVNPVPRGVDPA
jgi:hypothetical protein